MSDGCEFLERAGCCAGKWLCMAQSPRRQVHPESMGCHDPVENDCAVYARAVRDDG